MDAMALAACDGITRVVLNLTDRVDEIDRLSISVTGVKVRHNVRLGIKDMLTRGTSQLITASAKEATFGSWIGNKRELLISPNNHLVGAVGQFGVSPQTLPSPPTKFKSSRTALSPASAS
jgi:hypothetical protein